MATTSLMFTTNFNEVKRILTYFILIPICGSMNTGAQQPKIVIGPCSLPMIGVTTNFCCRTRNVPPRANIEFFMYEHHKYYDAVVATIQQPGCMTLSSFGVNVTCKQENDELVYSLMYLAMDIYNAIGTWGCRYSGYESTYTLNRYQVLTEHKQYIMVHPGDNAVLSWVISPRSDLNLQVFYPDGLPLLIVFQNSVTFLAGKVLFLGNLSTGDVSVQLKNVLENDIGTYTCSMTNNENIGITLVVLKKPLTPVISLKPGSVSKSGYKVEGKIICTSSSQSAAPMYYYTLLQYNWTVIYTQASYKTSTSWNELLLTDVDCRMDGLPPVYCAAKEKDAISDNSEPFYPYDLCSVTTLPSPKKELNQRITTLTVSAFVVTLIISLVLGFPWYRYTAPPSPSPSPAFHGTDILPLHPHPQPFMVQIYCPSIPTHSLSWYRYTAPPSPPPAFHVPQGEPTGANSQSCDNTHLTNRPPDALGAVSYADDHFQPPLAMPQEFDHDLQSVIEEIALQESRERNYESVDNNPSRNQQHNAQRGPSTGAFGAQPPMQVQSVPQEFDHDLQSVIEEIALQESRERNYESVDNNPSRNQQHNAQRGPSTGAFGAPPPVQDQCVPQEVDHDLQSVIEEIALQESRERNYESVDNNPSRNQQHNAQRGPSTGAFGAQPPVQDQCVPQEYEHRLQNVIEIIPCQWSREANYQLYDNNPSWNRQEYALRTASPGVASTQLPMQVQSIPWVFQPHQQYLDIACQRPREEHSPLHDNNPLQNRYNAQRTASAGVAGPQFLKEVESKLEELNQSLGEQALQIVVNRDNIVDNLICHYTDPVVPQSRVQVRMIGEDGMDAGGVTADMYTTFWNKAKEQFFIGCEAVVPYLPAHKMVEEEKFHVLGRILSHSVALLKTIPIPICTSTIIVMIYDTVKVPEETLLNDFLLFIASEDKDLISKALINYSSLSPEELGNLQSIFARYDYAGVIKESNFANHLIQLANNEICRKPKPLCELMRAGIPAAHMNVFWSFMHPDYLNTLYVVQKPTAMAIIARLQVDRDSINLSSGQKRAFQYLKDFLYELSPEELEIFVQFVTGKRSTPRDPIIITFSALHGFRRTPKAHTCSNLLELPATYEHYNAFKNEFKHLLKSDELMIMTME
ncbi:hypothetical protein CHS0354_040441 [Potamilus streckersoni]|uniref:HECT domain-containing protein n=1 Tax=Potamilus streckersoni TaxID=2493646 RepID=A0AAE0W5J7_9BIVA|nr:hypothetical protein CHS0354_040441 [Potamilus streckersoni]